MDNTHAPRDPPMAEEASGSEPESIDNPKAERDALQESFESPPPRRGSEATRDDVM